MPPSSRPERRRKRRNTKQQRTTSIVQAVLQDPRDATKMLDADLDAGGDPAIWEGILDAAEAALYLRGVKDLAGLEFVRRHLRRRVELG